MVSIVKDFSPARQGFWSVVCEDMQIKKTDKLKPLKLLAYFFLYAGYSATFIYRLSVLCVGKGKAGKILALMLQRLNFILSSSDLSPFSNIGPGLCLPHPTGIVIGNGCILGSNVKIYQNVTLGLRGSDKDGHIMVPKIGNDAVIYAGAVVAGPVNVGDNARIGANSVVLKDVPDNYTALGVPARNIPPRGNSNNLKFLDGIVSQSRPDNTIVEPV